MKKLYIFVVDIFFCCLVVIIMMLMLLIMMMIMAESISVFLCVCFVSFVFDWLILTDVIDVCCFNVDVVDCNFFKIFFVLYSSLSLSIVDFFVSLIILLLNKLDERLILYNRLWFCKKKMKIVHHYLHNGISYRQWWWWQTSQC